MRCVVTVLLGFLYANIAMGGETPQRIIFELTGVGQLRISDGENLVLELKSIEALQKITFVNGLNDRELDLMLPKAFGSNHEHQTRAVIASIQSACNRLGCKLRRVLIRTGGLVLQEVQVPTNSVGDQIKLPQTASPSEAKPTTAKP